jgi:hypothetical protein
MARGLAAHRAHRRGTPAADRRRRRRWPELLGERDGREDQAGGAPAPFPLGVGGSVGACRPHQRCGGRGDEAGQRMRAPRGRDSFPARRARRSSWSVSCPASRMKALSHSRRLVLGCQCRVIAEPAARRSAARVAAGRADHEARFGHGDVGKAGDHLDGYFAPLPYRQRNESSSPLKTRRGGERGLDRNAVHGASPEPWPALAARCQHGQKASNSPMMQALSRDAENSFFDEDGGSHVNCQFSR